MATVNISLLMNTLARFAWWMVMLPAPWGRRRYLLCSTSSWSPSVLSKFGWGWPSFNSACFPAEQGENCWSWYLTLNLWSWGTAFPATVRVGEKSSFLSFLGSFYHGVWLAYRALESYSLVAALLSLSSRISPLVSRLVVSVFKGRAGTVYYFNRGSQDHRGILHHWL